MNIETALDDRSALSPAFGPEGPWDGEEVASPDQTDVDRLEEHPDGWYWFSDDRHRCVGPFDSREAALADWQGPDQHPGRLSSDEAPDDPLTVVHETLDLDLSQDAWIDPDTGSLAEDTHLHLSEE
jgi:hypothetical protein